MAIDISVDKEKLLDVFRVRIGSTVEGVEYDPDAGFFKEYPVDEYAIWNFHQWNSTEGRFVPLYHPWFVELDHGVHSTFQYRKGSPYKLKKDDDGYAIYLDGKRLSGLKVPPLPGFLGKTASNGVEMKRIAQDLSLSDEEKSIILTYSDECAVKDKGETCLFCCYNRKRAEDDQPVWKNPKLLAEAAKAAYSEGYKHLTVTGGFVPERREVEYYLDVAEEIQDALGVENFHGTACIGAPQDISIIEKYKEAGYETISFNTEVWGKEWFNVICKGKASMCGGYDHWLEAVKYATEVFGHGKVRSHFVSGLQPKEVLYEGLETLAGWGVVTLCCPWSPRVGSPLEGHRSPGLDWHIDVLNKNIEILRNNDIHYNDVFYAAPERTYVADLYEILYHDKVSA